MHAARCQTARGGRGAVTFVLLAASWAAAITVLEARQAGDAAAYEKRPLSEAAAPDLAEGRKAYMAQCALCHGVDGSGGYGPTLLVATLTRAADDAGLVRILSNGIAGAMPGYGSANGVKRTWQLAAYVRTLGKGAAGAVTGDPARGATAYEKRGCAGCHVVSGKGRLFGPDLTVIGAQRGPAYLRRALLEPGAEVPEGHVVVTVRTKTGQAIRGVRVSEDVFGLHVRDVQGRLHDFRKADLAALEREAGASLMPAVGGSMPLGEVDDLVAYLASLRGRR
jgi:putative heme-binding domain-containing protein